MSEPLVTTHDSATHPQGVPRRVPPLHLITAVVLSTAAAVLVATLPATASSLVSSTAAGALAMVAAGLGAVVAIATRGRRLGAAALAATGAIEAVVFGLLLQTTQALVLAGYLLAFALPFVLGVVVVGMVRRHRVIRWPVLALAIVAVAGGVAAGLLRSDALGTLLDGLATGVGRAWPGLLLAMTGLAAALAWALVTVSLLGTSTTGRRLTATVVRHRTVITVLAALGPVPYGLVRMTWLTPWPLFVPATEALPPSTRLWGLLLGGAALLGGVLTIGLIRPWGERFPRWVPGAAGRPVPIAVAAVPGGLVAAVVTSAALPMIMLLSVEPTEAGPGGMTATERLLALLLFPCWIWGPLLGLAVWGYVGHRRGCGSLSAPVTAEAAR
jgi:hypothetical protein